MTHPFVSVVLATRNRAALLAETLHALTRQRWPRDRFEIIVADNGSIDDTRAAVLDAAARDGAPLVHYLYVAASGKSFAVNQALTLASGDLVAFTDDDVRPAPDWIERLAAAFDETGADFLAGRILPRWQTPPPAWLSPSLYGVLAVPENGGERRPIDAPDADVTPIGANMAVRREVIDRVRGFRTDLGKLDGTLRTGEDHELLLRMLDAGFHGAYEPSAVVEHWVPSDRLTRGYFRAWQFQNGRDVARLEAFYAHGVRRWLRVPRYLWRRAMLDFLSAVRALVRRDRRGRVAAAMRLIWFAGYVKEAWFGVRQSTPALEMMVGR
jgi:glycosyltransferase involved in cell wall biosynthesis